MFIFGKFLLGKLVILIEGIYDIVKFVFNGKYIFV